MKTIALGFQINLKNTNIEVDKITRSLCQDISIKILKIYWWRNSPMQNYLYKELFLTGNLYNEED